MRYELFQVNEERIEAVAFRPFVGLHAVQVADYHSAYTGDVDCDTDTDALERLFYVFNMQHPDDFAGYSLSMADVVLFDGNRAYYCDTVGWQPLDQRFTVSKAGEQEIAAAEEPLGAGEDPLADMPTVDPS